MLRRTRLVLALTLLAASGTVALAQTTTTNPLRPANSRAKAAETKAPETTAPAAEAPKPKRARSEAQLANDDRMRACGKEWRASKDKLKAEGKTWRVFNVECRARLKAAAGQKL